MNDEQLLRYSRHIFLPQIDIQGQEILIRSHALIIGAGGLGSPVAMYLAASGVGEITICDSDEVDLTNLQRQIVHNTRAIGTPKAYSAKKSLLAINPEINVIALKERVDERKLSRLVAKTDVVIDASDNFVTRHAVNMACVTHKKQLVSGAVSHFSGQVTTFNLCDINSPCYHCLFQENNTEEGNVHCTTGVFSPLVGIIGCIQAAEALKILLNIGETLSGRLILLNGLTMEWRSIKLNKDPMCPVCSILGSKISF
ncbi:molybdopterin biosynthesis protein MoeB [Nitrosomonadaceae bacterium]|nr:molybdopterin biosynthesis protein MoeB [Nitrosomonadaceae bacterium]